MKKVLLALAIVGASMALASCGNSAEEAAKDALAAGQAAAADAYAAGQAAVNNALN